MLNGSDLPRRIDKPWGHELLVVHNDRYALKDILIKAGTRSSLQSHHEKLESILVLSGKLQLESGHNLDRLTIAIYQAGGSYTLLPGTIHRVTAIEDTRLIEVSTPEIDDVRRHADDHGRAD